MYHEEIVYFSSCRETLVGKITLPQRVGIFPVIIFIQGSENSSPLNSSFFERISKPLLERGIASFIYAKRGVDESTGNWRKLSIQDRAIDTIAAVDYLQQRNDINVSKIGLFGHSQGGWVCQLAASMSTKIAFIISSAGPGENVFNQILTDKRNHLILEGVTNKEAIQKTNLLKIFLLILIKLKPFFKPHHLSYIIDYDPVKAIENITCPILALFGEKDPLVPPSKNVPLIVNGLKKANNNDFQIKIFKQANHSFYIAKTGSLKEYPELKKEFVPGYLETIVEWVSEIIKRNDRNKKSI